MTKKIYDYIFAAVMAALSIYIFFTANAFPKAGMREGYGPGFYPMLLAVIIFLCAAIVFFKTIRDKKEDEKIPELAPKALVKPGIFFGIMVLFCVLLRPLGLLADAFLYLILSTRFLFKVKWLPSLILSIVVSVIVWFVFKVAMRVPFPDGTLWTLLGWGV